MPQKHIFIVDDEPAHTLLTKRALEPITTSFIEASTVSDALDILERSAASIALIVLDINLYGEDGLEILKTLRTIDKEMPVVVLSTSSSIGDMKRSYALGANCYLVKDTDIKEYRKNIFKAVKYFLS